jgi:heme/copper-type cytochrome/quinol oxidase subunit 2
MSKNSKVFDIDTPLKKTKTFITGICDELFSLKCIGAIIFVLSATFAFLAYIVEKFKRRNIDNEDHKDLIINGYWLLIPFIIIVVGIIVFLLGDGLRNITTPPPKGLY